MQIYFDSTLQQLIFGNIKVAPCPATLHWIQSDRFVIYNTATKKNIIPELDFDEITDENDDPYSSIAAFISRLLTSISLFQMLLPNSFYIYIFDVLNQQKINALKE